MTRDLVAAVWYWHRWRWLLWRHRWGWVPRSAIERAGEWILTRFTG